MVHSHVLKQFGFVDIIPCIWHSSLVGSCNTATSKTIENEKEIWFDDGHLTWLHVTRNILHVLWFKYYLFSIDVLIYLWRMDESGGWATAPCFEELFVIQRFRFEEKITVSTTVIMRQTCIHSFTYSPTRHMAKGTGLIWSSVCLQKLLFFHFHQNTS